MKKMKSKLSVLGLSLMSAACSQPDTNYSVLATGQGFRQATVNNKIDLLWSIDNSQSMAPLQQNLLNNINAFTDDFMTRGFDFQLAVSTSDAYLASPNFRNNPSLARFRDGVGSNRTGVFVVTPATVNPIATFITNANQGQTGVGDERVFSSLRESLSSSLNQGFVRSNSFLGIIILSDEDDFSNEQRPEFDFSLGDHSYNDPNLESVDSYVRYFDGLTGSTSNKRNYSVSAITVLDAACQIAHKKAAPSTIIGKRYIELANKTGGVLGSVCDASFADALAAIQNRLVELSTQFDLQSKPIVETIRVYVNGTPIPENATNGWTYNADRNSLIFHGTAKPPSNALIGVYFDPESI